MPLAVTIDFLVLQSMEDCAPRALVGITRTAAPPFKYNHTFAREKYAGEEDCWVLPHCATTNKTLLPDLPTAILSPMVCYLLSFRSTTNSCAGQTRGTAMQRIPSTKQRYRCGLLCLLLTTYQLCRNFEASGSCKYGAGCRFAHGGYPYCYFS